MPAAPAEHTFYIAPPGPGTVLADWVRWAAAELEAAGVHFGHGTDNAVDEAAWLVSRAAGLAPDFGPADHGRVLDPAAAARARALVARRVTERRPAAYLLGEAWFAGRRFHVDERVLVPRSPLAELILDRFTPWVEPERVERVLDLCTGSGCIAVACALELPRARVDATDIDPGALAVAARNAAAHGVADRVRLLRSDLFADIPPARYDIIVSNPPYVDAAGMAALPEEYRREPALGLAAGDDGLDLVLPLLAAAPDFLAPGGILVVEVGDSAAALEACLPRVPFTWLEFRRGGEGVFLLHAEDVVRYRAHFAEAAASRGNS